jgi:hypothetical protein
MEQNYDLCYGLMIMKRYEDHSFEVKHWSKIDREMDHGNEVAIASF